MIPQDQLLNNPDKEFANKQYTKRTLYCPFCNDGRVQFKLLWFYNQQYYQCSNMDCQKIIRPQFKEKGISKLKGRMRNERSKLMGIVNITDQVGYKEGDKFNIDMTLSRRNKLTKDRKHIIVDFSDNNLNTFNSPIDIIRAVPYDIDDPSTWPKGPEQ